MIIRDVEARWANCTACKLHQTRTTVPQADRWIITPLDGAPLILVIGEAPGPEDDQQGKAFVGPAGQLLRSGYLLPGGVRFAYLTTAVACRPMAYPGHTPADSLAACSPRLLDVFDAIKPKGLILVGVVAQLHLRDAFPGIPRVEVLHPDVVLRHGCPSPQTERVLKSEVAKIQGLLQAIAGPKPEAPEPESDGAHQHEPVEAGYWRDEEGHVAATLRVCRTCNVLEPLKAEKKRKSKAEPVALVDAGTEP